jgi:hypothetical protein
MMARAPPAHAPHDLSPWYSISQRSRRHRLSISAEEVTTMNIKHSVFKALGAMSLLVVAGTVAMLLFR